MVLWVIANPITKYNKNPIFFVNIKYKLISDIILNKNQFLEWISHWYLFLLCEAGISIILESVWIYTHRIEKFVSYLTDFINSNELKDIILCLFLSLIKIPFSPIPTENIFTEWTRTCINRRFAFSLWSDGNIHIKQRSVCLWWICSFNSNNYFVAIITFYCMFNFHNWKCLEISIKMPTIKSVLQI